MNKNCIYFCIRSKKYKKYFYCKFGKKEINNKDCCYCNNKEIKKYKPINKKSKKKKSVNKETYQYVYLRDNGKCRLCGNSKVELHHIIYRSEAVNLIDDPNNCILLCKNCHLKVHSNKSEWQPKLIEMVYM